MNLLYLGSSFDAPGGRENLSTIIRDSLNQYPNLCYHEFLINTSEKKSSVFSFSRLAYFIFNKLSLPDIRAIYSMCTAIKPTLIFIDGSNFGVLTLMLKFCSPFSTLIIFYHNSEACFFADLYVASKYSIKALLVLLANTISEIIASNLAHVRIFLTNHDQKFINGVFSFPTLGSPQKDFVLPLAVSRSLSIRLPQALDAEKLKVLFVGTNFFANVEGAKWFCTNVLPFVEISLDIVGRGFTFQTLGLPELPPNLTIHGFVNDLSHLYANSNLVIAPIFSGSGMKTKVAESLMHGRPVLGTTNAFRGYEDCFPLCGKLCNKPSEYIDVLSNPRSFLQERHPIALFDLYASSFSVDSLKDNLQQVLSSL